MVPSWFVLPLVPRVTYLLPYPIWGRFPSFLNLMMFVTRRRVPYMRRSSVPMLRLTSLLIYRLTTCLSQTFIGSLHVRRTPQRRTLVCYLPSLCLSLRSRCQDVSSTINLVTPRNIVGLPRPSVRHVAVLSTRTVTEILHVVLTARGHTRPPLSTAPFSPWRRKSWSSAPFINMTVVRLPAGRGRSLLIFLFPMLRQRPLHLRLPLPLLIAPVRCLRGLFRFYVRPFGLPCRVPVHLFRWFLWLWTIVLPTLPRWSAGPLVVLRRHTRPSLTLLSL